jgi:hypothetical protein
MSDVLDSDPINSFFTKFDIYVFIATLNPLQK